MQQPEADPCCKPWRTMHAGPFRKTSDENLQSLPRTFELQILTSGNVSLQYLFLIEEIVRQVVEAGRCSQRRAASSTCSSRQSIAHNDGDSVPGTALLDPKALVLFPRDESIAFATRRPLPPSIIARGHLIAPLAKGAPSRRATGTATGHV